MCRPGGHGIDAEAVASIIRELAGPLDLGVQVAMVVGGGNFVRGRDLAGSPSIHRVTADHMGMLATVINAVALRDSMRSAGIAAEVLSAFDMPWICRTFSATSADELLSAGRVAIFAGGTGSPFFSTDTCAALRANEIGAEVVFKATKVDGVFDDDPVRNAKARKYDRLSYSKVLADRLGVMDLTAISLCMETRLPIVVFQLDKPGNLLDAVTGRPVGTMVCGDE
jgi:uridylate kinase